MIRIVMLAALLCLASGLRAQTLQVEPLDALTQANAGEPHVAVESSRGFVLTWQARLEDGVTALRFRRVDRNGEAGEIGEIARGRSWFVNWADFPSLAVLDNGDWLAHWLQRRGAGYAYDIRMARSADGGASWSDPFTPHTDGTRSEHGFVALAPQDEASALAVWLDGRHTVRSDDETAHADGHHAHGGGAMTLRAARITSDGVIDGVELDGRVCDCCQTDAVRSGTDTLVVYRGRTDEEVRDVRFIRHDGERWQPSQTLFDEGWRIPGCPVNGPAIAAHGPYVIAAAYTEAEKAPTVRVRTSTNGGRRWREPVTVVQGETLGRLDVVALPEGRFMLVRLDTVGTDAQLRLSLHDDTGAVTETTTLAMLPSGRLTGFPRMAALDGTVLVAWNEPVEGRPRVKAARVRVTPVSP